MAENTAFTAGTATETDWALMHRTTAPDGLLAHYLSAGTGNVTASTTTVTVAPHAAMVNGYEYTLDAPKAMNAASVGVAPAVGQSRIDRVVYEYDAERDPADRIQLKIKPGVADATPTMPALIQTADLWEFERARYTWVYGTPITTGSLVVSDVRTAGVTIARPGTRLPEDARSRVVIRDNAIWVADDAATKGTFVYRRIDSPPWTPADLHTTEWEMYADARPMAWRLHDGLLEITGQVRLKASAGLLSTETWSAVCYLPLAAIENVRPQVYTHVSAHIPSGKLLTWRFTRGSSGVSSAIGILEVQSATSTELTHVNLSVFQIPVGA